MGVLGQNVSVSILSNEINMVDEDTGIKVFLRIKKRRENERRGKGYTCTVLNGRSNEMPALCATRAKV